MSIRLYNKTAKEWLKQLKRSSVKASDNNFCYLYILNLQFNSVSFKLPFDDNVVDFDTLICHKVNGYEWKTSDFSHIVKTYLDPLINVNLLFWYKPYKDNMYQIDGLINYKTFYLSNSGSMVTLFIKNERVCLYVENYTNKNSRLHNGNAMLEIDGLYQCCKIESRIYFINIAVKEALKLHFANVTDYTEWSNITYDIVLYVKECITKITSN